MPKIALFRTKLFQVFFIIAMVVGIGISFAIDSDNDGMSDLYENFFKLSPTNSQDAAEKYDSDLLDNLAEFGLWTDPDRADTDTDGFPDHADSNALSRAAILWAQHHTGILLVARSARVGLEVFGGELVDCVDQEMCDVAGAQPIAHIGRHEHRGIAIEVLESGSYGSFRLRKSKTAAASIILKYYSQAKSDRLLVITRMPFPALP